MKTRIVICCFVYFLSVPTQAQHIDSLRIMFWNVENLFDCKHDSLKQDQEFLPEALRHWHYGRYKKKLADVARTIAAVGEWKPPVLVGLCEVENDSVLRNLTRYSPLKKYGYRYVMTNSPDNRGIDVALLYQRGHFKLINHRSIRIPCLHAKERPTRDILHVTGVTLNLDTLHVFVVHTPSRSGGQKASEPRRLQVAQIIKDATDSLFQTSPDSKIIIMGDFNDYPHNKSIAMVLGATAPIPPLKANKLYNLLASQSKQKEVGSYKYKGEWGLLDQLIVSGALLDSNGNTHTSEEMAHIARLTFLLTEDAKYGGVQPFRTYNGMRYQGGFSDHLPIYMDLNTVPYDQ